MATSAVAQGTIASLRQSIAGIEGRLAETLDGPPGSATVLRRHGVPEPVLLTGIEGLDAALGGGLPMAALTEIHGSIAHGAGAAASFALALVALAADRSVSPASSVLWIGEETAFAEGGLPYAHGLRALAGLVSDDILVARARETRDVLWIAEEAVGVDLLRAVLIEIHGNPRALSLTATRRLHRRAQAAGRPVFLLRQSGEPLPTAAPVRLVVEPAASGLRATYAGSMAGSLGHSAFTVTLSKSRMASPGQFILEWNPDEHRFVDRQPQDSGAVVSVPAVRPRLSPASGSVLAFRETRTAPARLQPPRGQHETHSRPQRTG